MERDLCHINYATNTFKIGFFDKNRVNVENCSKCIQSYEERSVGGKSRQVPEHYRKQLLKMQMWVEEATKVFERSIRRILGEQKKHEVQGNSFSSPAKHTKCQNM